MIIGDQVNARLFPAGSANGQLTRYRFGPLYPNLSPSQIYRHVEEHEAALLDIHLEGGPMVDPVVHVPRDCGMLVALAGVLRRLEVPVSVVPGQQHVLAQKPLGLLASQPHGLQVVPQGRIRGQFQDLDPGHVEGLR